MGRTRFMQGRYAPKHPEKYIGDPGNVIYRSGWERRFMVYCDQTPGILRWQSEEFHIPYTSPLDGRVHRYFPDFLVESETNSGKQTLVIEIKPHRQTIMPKRRGKNFLREASTLAVNTAKWQAAEQYCKERHWKFVVFTEQHLFGRT